MKNFILTTVMSVFLLVIISATTSFASCVYVQTIKAEEFAMGNMLTWATSQETNNKAFLIQKSTDGVNYQTIGKVKGTGTSEGKAYRFLDIAAAEGVTHYRLEQVDFDGTKNLSKTIQISKITSNNFVVVSMTPPEQGGLVEITVNAFNETDLTYTVERGNGKMVYMGTQKLNAGVNMVSVDVSDMELGTYRISLKGGNESETLTFKTTEKQPVKPFADFTDGK